VKDRDAPVKDRDAPVKDRDAPVKHRDAPVTSGSSRTAPTKPIAMCFDPTRKFEAITPPSLRGPGLLGLRASSGGVL
jgi:hypothetical protein